MALSDAGAREIANVLRQHVTPTTVEYEQTFVLPRKHPSKVTISEAATTIDVKAA